MKMKLLTIETIKMAATAFERRLSRPWLMDVVLVYCSYCSAWVEVALELLEAITSANVIAVMLNVFGNLRWQRLVPFVDRQVPGRLSVRLYS